MDCWSLVSHLLALPPSPLLQSIVYTVPELWFESLNSHITPVSCLKSTAFRINPHILFWPSGTCGLVPVYLLLPPHLRPPPSHSLYSGHTCFFPFSQSLKLLSAFWLSQEVFPLSRILFLQNFPWWALPWYSGFNQSVTFSEKHWLTTSFKWCPPTRCLFLYLFPICLLPAHELLRAGSMFVFLSPYSQYLEQHLAQNSCSVHIIK